MTASKCEKNLTPENMTLASAPDNVSTIPHFTDLGRDYRLTDVAGNVVKGILA